MNRTYNSKKAIIHQMKINIYYKNYIKRIKMYMYNLGKTDIILEIPQLRVYNPKITWKIKKVKMIKYLLIR